jgi:uncharacterized protein (UPF0371 family)
MYCPLELLLMKQAGVKPEDRKVVAPALEREKQTGEPAAAMELPDGTILTGRTSDLSQRIANFQRYRQK